MSASKSLRFSTETSHVYSDPAACTSYTTPLAQSTPVPSSRQAFLFTGISPLQTKNNAFSDSQDDVHGDLRKVSKDFHLSKPGCSDSTIVKLHVHYPSKNLNKTLVGSYQTLGKSLAHGVPSQIAKAVMNCPTVRIHIVSSVIKAVSKEVSGLCGKSRPSILRKTSKEDLQNFDLQKLCEEWQERAPIFYAFLLNSAGRINRKGTWFASVAIAGSILLKQRNREMNATAAVMGILLKSKAAEVILIPYTTAILYRAESKWVSGIQKELKGKITHIFYRI